MAHVRASVAALAAVALAAAVAPRPAAAQPGPKDNLPVRPPQMSEVNAYKTAGEIARGDLPKAKVAFEAFAKFYADYVSHPRVHTAPQEFRPEPPPPGSGYPLTVDQLINEINRALVIPSPVPVPNPVVGLGNMTVATNPKEADYIRELGAALDKELAKTVREAPERVVRVNATRLLAAACRSGAQAHYPTVSDLITNPTTDPEVRYYALQAAGNLLSAYDLNDYRSRKHSHDPQVVGALVTALQNAVLKSDAILPLVDVPVEKGVKKVVPPDQVPVLRFIRRQAVRSLGQVRFAEYEAEKGKTLYPSHTLALVALSKVPVETFQASADKIQVGEAPRNQMSDAAEAGEAVLGILNMAPPRGGAAGKKYAPPMADVIATGVTTWVTPRVSDPGSKALPWKGTAARLEEGLKTWQGLYDVNFNPAQPAIKADLVPPAASGVAKAITDNVIDPINSPTRAVSVTNLQTYQRDILRQNKDYSPQPFLTPGGPAVPLP